MRNYTLEGPANPEKTFPINLAAKNAPRTVRPETWLVLLTLACLIPFVGKAFHIDDTLFLRAAQQISEHPLNFYGFDINWFGDTTPMIEAFDNPPLTSYYIALAAAIGGWKEVALHIAFLLPAMAAAVGTYFLAKNYCSRPLLAGVAAVLTPVFLVSATSVMCDVTLLAFWVWAVVLFEKGVQTKSTMRFLASGCLAGLAVLTKFPGLSLVPLLGVYGLIKIRRVGWWLLAPLVPLLFALGYELWTYHLYGHGLFTYAAQYTSEYRQNTHGGVWENAVLGIGFMGGCFLPVVFLTPWLWSRRVCLTGIVLFGICLIGLPYLAGLTKLLWQPQGGLNWGTLLQAAVFTFTGIEIFVLAAADFRKRRDAVSLMLLLWTTGVVVFGVRINWTVTARSFLPMAPALGILIARRLEAQQGLFRKADLKRLFLPTLAAAAVSLVVVKADYDLADSNRRAARQLAQEYKKAGHTLWFGGHWGFQYYMENLGAKPIEARRPEMKPGDIAVYQNHGSNIGIPDLKTLKSIGTVIYFPNRHLSTMNPEVGAGFYAAVMGPLPFAMGQIESEKFQVFEVK